MANGACSRGYLSILNGLLAIMSVLVIGFASYALADPENVTEALGVLLPKTAFTFALISGISLFLLAMLGLCSTKFESKGGLAVYILLVTTIFVVELIATFYILNKYNVIKDAKVNDWSEGNLAGAAQEVFDAVSKEALATAESQANWVKTQNVLKCCGYGDPADPKELKNQVTAARLCSSPDYCDVGVGALASKSYCKEKLIAKVEKYELYVIITLGTLAFLQLVSIIAASRLACCVSKDDGGYMEEWRPGTQMAGTGGNQPRQQQQQRGGPAIADESGGRMNYL